jgi:hypothetical protein
MAQANVPNPLDFPRKYRLQRHFLRQKSKRAAPSFNLELLGLN